MNECPFCHCLTEGLTCTHCGTSWTNASHGQWKPRHWGQTGKFDPDYVDRRLNAPTLYVRYQSIHTQRQMP